MKKPAPPFWQLPAIIAASVTGLGVLGTGIVKLSGYLTLPDRVEAGEQKNEQQDSAIDKLTAINETWQQIYQQQTANQAAPMPAPWTFLREERDWQVFRDPEGTEQCCDGTRCVPVTKRGKCPR